MPEPRTIATRVEITESAGGIQVEVLANFDLEGPMFKDTAARTLAYIAYKAVVAEINSRDGDFSRAYVTGDPRSLAAVGEVPEI